MLDKTVRFIPANLVVIHIRFVVFAYRLVNKVDQSR